MRTVVERVAAVRSRSKRLRQARTNRMFAALACLVALPLVGFAGRFVAEGPTIPSTPDGGLFGAASLFGPSADGYMLAAESVRSGRAYAKLKEFISCASGNR